MREDEDMKYDEFKPGDLWVCMVNPIWGDMVVSVCRHDDLVDVTFFQLWGYKMGRKSVWHIDCVRHRSLPSDEMYFVFRDGRQVNK